MTNLTIGTETFNVAVDGDDARPVLMLSHALGLDLSMWDAQMEALTAQFRVVRYDTRGHGGSPVADRPCSIADLGRDALAILDTLGIEKTHWLGVSMGGAVGLWLLAHAPERIDRAILANTAAKLGAPDIWNDRIIAVRKQGMEPTAEATLERWFSEAFTTDAPDRVAGIHKLLRRMKPEGYAACCAALRDMDLRDRLNGIVHEVLVVGGRDDPTVPPDAAKAFADGLPNARHVELPTRHLSNIEADAAFNATVLAFLTAKRARVRAAKPTPRVGVPRKAATVKAATAKRGSASRRSNAARSPLTKPAAKRAAAVPAPARKAAGKKTTATRRPAAKVAAKRKATTVGRKPAAKVAPVRAPAKKQAKATTTRRPTSAAPARAPVKSATKTTRPTKRVVKTAVKKAVPKGVAKKTPATKAPVTRRKPATKPRRPTGRRKP